jgi:hypothetical protein
MVVRIHPRQPFQMRSAECGLRNRGSREIKVVAVFHSAPSIPHSALKTLGGEIESRLANTQESRGQNLPERHLNAERRM